MVLSAVAALVNVDLQSSGYGLNTTVTPLYLHIDCLLIEVFITVGEFRSWCSKVAVMVSDSNGCGVGE
jgi:hypothetical protein